MTVSLGKLMRRRVTVKTIVGDFHGTLKGYDKSLHNGIGSLVLLIEDGVAIVKDWMAVCLR